MTVKNNKSAVKNDGFVLQMNTNNDTCEYKVGFAPARSGLPVAAGDLFVVPAAILQGFGGVAAGYLFAVCEVGDSAGDFHNAVIATH